MHMTPEAEKLSLSLRQILPEVLPGPVEITDLGKLSAGASREAWSIDVTDAAGETHGLVLKRDPPHARIDPELSETNFSLDRPTEANLLRAAGRAGVPVPAVLWHGDGSSPLGAGLIMQRIAGESLGQRIVRGPDFAAARENLAFQCGAALAKVHAIPLDDGPLDEGLPDIAEMPAQASMAFYEGQMRHFGWSQPGFEYGLAWLRERIGDIGQRRTFVHGDFRLGNLIIGPTGLNAVIDWEICHIGDPVLDLGWVCIRAWRYGAALPVGGFGERSELLEGYYSGGGAEVDALALRYWEVFGCLRWGVMCLNMAYGHLSGDYRSIERAVIGRRAAEAEYDLLQLVD
jgi:aminoglycoside phosphotransferase (APT) family kinase protein